VADGGRIRIGAVDADEHDDDAADRGRRVTAGAGGDGEHNDSVADGGRIRIGAVDADKHGDDVADRGRVVAGASETGVAGVWDDMIAGRCVVVVAKVVGEAMYTGVEANGGTECVGVVVERMCIDLVSGDRTRQGVVVAGQPSGGESC
jgi:hypothetical protein